MGQEAESLTVLYLGSDLGQRQTVSSRNPYRKRLAPDLKATFFLPPCRKWKNRDQKEGERKVVWALSLSLLTPDYTLEYSGQIYSLECQSSAPSLWVSNLINLL